MFESLLFSQIEVCNAGRHQLGTLNGGIDLNSASNILRDENQHKHNVINMEDGWVAPMDQVVCEHDKINKIENFQDTKL